MGHLSGLGPKPTYLIELDDMRVLKKLKNLDLPFDLAQHIEVLQIGARHTAARASAE